MQTLYKIIGIGAFLIAPFVLADSSPNIFSPITELGNCNSKEACAAYCDIPENGPACLEYGKKQGLISEDQAKALEVLPEHKGPGGCFTDTLCREYCSDPLHIEECIAFAKTHNLLDKKDLKKAEDYIEKEGPGGCRGPEECKVYCENPSNINACVDFAVKSGFMSKEDGERAKAFGKPGPGGCRGAACKDYCNDSSHIEECTAFAEENGFLSKDDATRIKKLALNKGPGGCRGQEECKTYCEDSFHQKECLDFAKQNGFLSEEDAAKAEKLLNQVGPGGCKGSECKDYCQDPAHQQECLDFAAQNNLISPKELERAKKFIRVSQEGGPGGCKGESACKEFCQNPQNQQACFEFAKKEGLIDPEDEQNFEVGQKLQATMKASGGPGGCKTEDECRMFCSDPTNIEACIAFASAHGGISADKAQDMLKNFAKQKFEGAGEFLPPEDFKQFEQEHLQRFEEFRQLEQEFRGMKRDSDQESASFAGPGGCTSPDECIKYCTEHKEKCFSFGESGKPDMRPPEGDIPPGHDIESRLRPDLLRPFDPSQISPEEIQQRMKQEYEQKYREAYDRQKQEIQTSSSERNVPDRPLPPEFMTEFKSREFHQMPAQGVDLNRDYRQPPTNVGPIPGTPGVFSPLDKLPEEQYHMQQPTNSAYPPPPSDYQYNAGGTYNPPPSGSYTLPPPDSGSYVPPLPSPPPPTSRINIIDYLGAFLYIFR